MNTGLAQAAQNAKIILWGVVPLCIGQLGHPH